MEPSQWGPSFDTLQEAIAYQTGRFVEGNYHYKVVEQLPDRSYDRVLWARGATAWGARQVDPTDWDGDK